MPRKASEGMHRMLIQVHGNLAPSSCTILQRSSVEVPWTWEDWLGVQMRIWIFLSFAHLPRSYLLMMLETENEGVFPSTLCMVCVMWSTITFSFMPTFKTKQEMLKALEAISACSIFSVLIWRSRNQVKGFRAGMPFGCFRLLASGGPICLNRCPPPQWSSLLYFLLYNWTVLWVESAFGITYGIEGVFF